MSIARSLLLALLLGLGAVSARAQDPTDEAPAVEPAPEQREDRIFLNVRGHAEAITSSIAVEFIVRGEADNAADAEKKYTKEIAQRLKTMRTTAPVDSAISIEVTAHRREQAASYIFKLQATNNAPFQRDVGATFVGRFFIEIKGLGKLPPDLACDQVAELLDKLASCKLTGIEDYVDIISLKLEGDIEAVRARSYANAIATAKRRAESLAKASGRKLGKIVLVRDNTATVNTVPVSNEVQNFFNQDWFHFVYPMPFSGWWGSLTLAIDTELSIGFELE